MYPNEVRFNSLFFSLSLSSTAARIYPLYKKSRTYQFAVSCLPDHSGLRLPPLRRGASQVRGGPVRAPGVDGGSGPAAAEVRRGAERVARRSGDGDGRHDPHEERAVVQAEEKDLTAQH